MLDMALVSIPHRSFSRPKGKVAVILADFHREIAEGLLEGFEEVLKEYPEVSFELHRVPGAFEIPLVAKRLAQQKTFDVLVALGCVVKGDTYHFEMVAQECARGCLQVMLEENTPLVFQVLAPLHLEDGLKRSRGEFNHGKLAAYTALDWLTQDHV